MLGLAWPSSIATLGCGGPQRLPSRCHRQTGYSWGALVSVGRSRGCAGIAGSLFVRETFKTNSWNNQSSCNIGRSELEDYWKGFAWLKGVCSCFPRGRILYSAAVRVWENAQKVSLEEKFQPRGHRHRPYVFPIFCDPKPINYFF